jgi:hypothetical protein
VTTADFVRAQLVDRREHGRHRGVDPQVDRTELRFHAMRRGTHRVGIGEVEGQRQSRTAQSIHFGRRFVQCLPPSRDEADAGSPSREGGRGGAADACRGARDHGGHRSIHCRCPFLLPAGF